MNRRTAALLLYAGFLSLLAGCSSPNRDEFQVPPTEPAAVLTSTLAASQTVTATLTPTATATSTSTPSPTPSPTLTATSEPTATLEPTVTPTPTPDQPLLYIDDLTLNDIDGSPLQFLSADVHPHFGGFTLIHGTIAIAGEGEVVDIVLEVSDHATDAAFEVPLTASAREQLLQPLGDDGSVEIVESQLLFEIPSTAFAPFDKSADGYVSLRLKARTSDGREAVRGADYRYIKKLVRYTADNRYFVGEEQQGGNGWVTPNVKALAEQLPDVQFGDFSNMNGGPFPPHFSHQLGVDIDVWFFGYNNLDAEAARFMLDLLNQPGVIERVDLLFAAYTQTDGDPFWEEIRDAILLDGRPAGEVFVPDAGHTGHFHLRLRE